MTQALRRLLGGPRLNFVKNFILVARGLMFAGQRYECPCCGWSVRGFTGRWGLIRSNEDGYCPRCNAKARHRRIWLYLEEQSLLSTPRCRVLEVAPWWSFARRFQRMTHVDHVGLDLQRAGPQVTVVGDAAAAPFRAETFDLVLCTHVLEHVDDDRRVISELHDVLKPGGVALVSVPLRLGGRTLEDPRVTDPEERLRLFGERSHVRYYGLDLSDRLSSAGFAVQLDMARDIRTDVRRRFGLRDDENLFHCVKG